jgi:hypothetical protein
MFAIVFYRTVHVNVNLNVHCSLRFHKLYSQLILPLIIDGFLAVMYLPSRLFAIHISDKIIVWKPSFSHSGASSEARGGIATYGSLRPRSEDFRTYSDFPP